MTSIALPEKMTAVVLDAYSGSDGLRVETRAVPRPGKNEVLVKVAASPLNPSDLVFLEGRYGFKKALPAIPGFEGSGVVVASGPGLLGRYFMGKRVACLSGPNQEGVWAEYMVASTTGGVLPLHDAVDLEQGAMSVVNPLTACAFIELAKRDRHKSIVLTAAASALGIMVNRLCQAEGIQVINVVRRDAQAGILRQQGADIILNSEATGFDQELMAACDQYRARLAFDAVAGPLTLRLLEAMPRHSRVTVYGALSGAAVQANPGQLIFADKSIDGFWLAPWIGGKNLLQTLLTWRRAQQLVMNELKSEIRARYPLSQAKQAVAEYQRQMTGGKILFSTALRQE